MDPSLYSLGLVLFQIRVDWSAGEQNKIDNRTGQIIKMAQLQEQEMKRNHLSNFWKPISVCDTLYKDRRGQGWKPICQGKIFGAPPSMGAPPQHIPIRDRGFLSILHCKLLFRSTPLLRSTPLKKRYQAFVHL